MHFFPLAIGKNENLLCYLYLSFCMHFALLGCNELSTRKSIKGHFFFVHCMVHTILSSILKSVYWTIEGNSKDWNSFNISQMMRGIDWTWKLASSSHFGSGDKRSTVVAIRPHACTQTANFLDSSNVNFAHPNICAAGVRHPHMKICHQTKKQTNRMQILQPFFRNFLYENGSYSDGIFCHSPNVATMTTTTTTKMETCTAWASSISHANLYIIHLCLST